MPLYAKEAPAGRRYHDSRPEPELGISFKKPRLSSFFLVELDPGDVGECGARVSNGREGVGKRPSQSLTYRGGEKGGEGGAEGRRKEGRGKPNHQRKGKKDTDRRGSGMVGS